MRLHTVSENQKVLVIAPIYIFLFSSVNNAQFGDGEIHSFCASALINPIFSLVSNK